MAKLYLIDGSGYVFRAYFGMARDRAMRLTAQDGTPTNAVYAFNQMLQRLLKDVGANSDTLLGIAFDLPGKTFRDELYPEYKANRQATPEDLSPQIPLIHELVDAYDIPVLNVDGFEADDVIATLAKAGAAAGHEVTVVSADKDLMQLVQPGIGMWDPMRDAHYGRAEVREKFGVWPEQLGDYLALVGDSVDNVPGVPKVGKKTAEELIAQFGNLDAVLERSAEIAKKSVREAIEGNKASALLSKQLVTLCETVPIQLDTERLRYTGPLRDKLEPLFTRLSFSSKRVDDAMATVNGTPAAQVGAKSFGPMIVRKDESPSTDLVSREAYRVVADATQLDALVEELRAAGRFSLVVEGTSADPMRAEIVGLGVCAASGRAAYVPISHHYLGVPAQLPWALVRDKLNTLLEQGACALVGHDVKRCLHVLRNAGVEVAALGDDSTLLSYVVDPGVQTHGLAYLSRVHLGHDNLALSDLVGKGKAPSFDAVTIEQAAAYCSEQADVALRLVELLRAKLSDKQLSLYTDVELPLLRVLFEMEHRGIAIEPSRLGELRVLLSAQMAEQQKEINALAGYDVNVNSPKQLAQLLFEKLQLPVVKKTKTGPSTDHSVLEQLAEEHPMPKKILDYRQAQKLLSTYVEALPQLVHPKSGRVHTNYNQALAATGRLSSSDPNLQNIPVKTELGRRIRGAFVPAPGWRFVSADYSQVELRMLAHLSGDDALLTAFQQGLDIHARTAAALFGVDEAAVTPDMRRRAKVVNFGLLYGLSAFRLSREEGVSIAEAKVFIDAYFNAYPKVRGYIDETLAFGRRHGYVETILGRRRYLPDLNSKNHTARQAAERVATNTPIQGSAADLIKVAMLHVDRALREAGMQARLLLQVHDELVLEAPAAEADAAAALVRERMGSAMAVRVPLETSVSIGDDWAGVH